MLQVTFRNLLPSESLLGIARDEYAAARRRGDLAAGPLWCCITISAETDGWRELSQVRVELLRDGHAMVRATTASHDAAAALRTCIRAASGGLPGAALVSESRRELPPAAAVDPFGLAPTTTLSAPPPSC